MALISKIDKKTWDNYVSNLEKTIILPSTKNTNNLKKNIRSSTNPRLLKKRRIEPDCIIDLHGHSLYSGKLFLKKNIINCYEKNIRSILVITGKGIDNKGALKEEVPKWLNDKSLNRYLVSFNQAPKHFGGEGALLVRIKNKYKNQY